MSEYTCVLDNRPWQSIKRKKALKMLRQSDFAQVKRVGEHWYAKQQDPVYTTKQYDVTLPEGIFTIVGHFRDGEFFDSSLRRSLNGV